MSFIDVLFTVTGMVGGAGLAWMAFSAKLAALRGRLAVTSETLEETRSEKTALHERAITAEAEKKSLEQRLKEQQEHMRLEFKNTSTTLFEEMSKKFSTHSEKQIGDLLNPLRDRLGEFQKLVVDSFGAQGKEQHTLKAEIGKIVLQTDSLTRALRGDVKAQGNWGEVMLERILEESGLRRDVDYVLQATDMGLSGESGNRLRPDVIVKLPDNKHIVIDAKVSLTAYERYCAATTEEERAPHLKDFLKSIRAHVNGLEQKRYQDIEKLGTPDLILMFMPIEGAYSLAMQNDPELYPYGWGKKIAIVSPTNLFVNLLTIASLWRIEQQNQNAQEIARQGGVLYDKFYGFVDDMLSIGKQVTRLQDSYDQAMNKLSKGRGNLVDGTEKLKNLGAKASKALPKIIKSDDSDEMLVDGAEELPVKPRLTANAD
jgi:DNA recombination protein RmuC